EMPESSASVNRGARTGASDNPLFPCCLQATHELQTLGLPEASPPYRSYPAPPLKFLCSVTFAGSARPPILKGGAKCLLLKPYIPRPKCPRPGLPRVHKRFNLLDRPGNFGRKALQSIFCHQKRIFDSNTDILIFADRGTDFFKERLILWRLRKIVERAFP